MKTYLLSLILVISTYQLFGQTNHIIRNDIRPTATTEEEYQLYMREKGYDIPEDWDLLKGNVEAIEAALQSIDAMKRSRFIGNSDAQIEYGDDQHEIVDNNSRISDAIIYSYGSQIWDYFHDHMDFKKSRLTLKKFISDAEFYEFYFETDTLGNIIDTLQYDLFIERPGQTNTYYRKQHYYKIEGHLRLIQEFDDYVTYDIYNACNVSRRVSEYGRIYQASIYYDQETDSEYIGYIWDKKQSGDSTIDNRYSLNIQGDTVSVYKTIEREEIGEIVYIRESFDDIGNRIYGYKVFNNYDQGNKLESLITESWDVGERVWSKTQRNFVYDQENKLIQELYYAGHGDQSLTEYAWNNDTIESITYEYYYDDQNKWLVISRKEYEYRIDTTLMTRYSIDFNTEELRKAYELWHIYDSINNDSYEVIVEGNLFAPPYDRIDTLINQGSLSKNRKLAIYDWNGVDYELTRFEERIVDEYCNVLKEEELSYYEGTKAEYEYEYYQDQGYMTKGLNYTSLGSNSNWELDEIFEAEYMPHGEEVFLKSFYRFNKYGARKEVVDYNEQFLEISHGYYDTDDTTISDNIEWWLYHSVNLTYDDLNRRKKREYYERESKEQELHKTWEINYLYSDVGSKGWTSYRFNEGTKSLEDSFRIQRDSSGIYLSNSFYRFHMDTLQRAFKTFYFHTEDPFADLCGHSITGDTIIIDSPVKNKIDVEGLYSTVKWEDSKGHLISDSSAVIVDLPGFYSVYIYSKGCETSDTFKIWRWCNVTIEGDSVLANDEAIMTASIDTDEQVQYIWYSESDEEVSSNANYSTDAAGVYFVKGIGEFCYGENSWRISLATITQLNGVQKYLVIYPNPVSKGSSLQLNGTDINNKVSIYNVRGYIQMVGTIDHTGGITTIDVSSLEPGVYLLKYTAHQGERVHRFVIE